MAGDAASMGLHATWQGIVRTRHAVLGNAMRLVASGGGTLTALCVMAGHTIIE